MVFESTLVECLKEQVLGTKRGLRLSFEGVLVYLGLLMNLGA